MDSQTVSKIEYNTIKQISGLKYLPSGFLPGLIEVVCNEVGMQRSEDVDKVVARAVNKYFNP